MTSAFMSLSEPGELAAFHQGLKERGYEEGYRPPGCKVQQALREERLRLIAAKINLAEKLK